MDAEPATANIGSGFWPGSLRQRLRLAGLRLVPRLARRPPSSVSQSRRILLIRPDHLGDVLFMTPALRVLRRSCPDAEIVALVGPWSEVLLRGNPDVDRVVTCEFPGFGRRPKRSPLEPYRMLKAEADRLRVLDVDTALICRADHWWGALLAYLAGIPDRIGYDLPETRPFLTRSLEPAPDQHAVIENLRLVDCITGGHTAEHADPSQLPMRYQPSSDDEAFAANFASQLPRDGPIAVIHPGAGAPVKRWTPDRAAAVSSHLLIDRGFRVLLTGGPGERDLVEAIVGRLEGPVATGLGLTLGQLAAILARCRLAVGPDSGVLHLAVAVGTPTVHLFGPVDERRFGPWGPARRHRVVRSNLNCVPCNRLDFPEAELQLHPCIRLIEISAINHAIDKVLAVTDPIPSG